MSSVPMALKAHAKEEKAEHNEAFRWQWLFFIAAIDWWSTIAFWSSGAYQDLGPLAPFAALFLVIAVVAVYQLISYGMKIESTGKGTIGVILKTFGVNSPIAIGIRLYFFSATQLDIAFTEGLEVPDAMLHIIENPMFASALQPVEHWFAHELPWMVEYFGSSAMTLVWILSLLMFVAIGRLFWNRSSEAVILCAVVIALFVSLYTATFVTALPDMMAATPAYLERLASTCPSAIACIGRVIFESPGQALGLSGVEAMPFLIPLVMVAVAVKLEKNRIEERVKGVKKILLVASIGMSFLLLTSIWMAATLLTPEMVQAGGVAKDRATSWAMHHYLGESWGTLGDVSLILMLALASSSVVPVLVNAYPRILGPLGIHPQLLRRKVVIVIQTALCILIATVYRADVKLMTGSYAVGVMQLLAGLSVAAIVDILLSQLPFRKKITLTLFGGFIIYTSVSVLLLKPEGFHNFGYTFVGVSLFVIVGNIIRAFDRRADGLRAWVNLAFRPDQITNNGDVNLISVASIPTTIEQITEILRKVYIPEGKIPVFLHVQEAANMAFEDGILCELHVVEGYPVITAQAKSWVVAVPLIVHAVHEMGKKPHVNFVQAHGASVAGANYELLYSQPDEDDPKRPVFHGPIY